MNILEQYQFWGEKEQHNTFFNNLLLFQATLEINDLILLSGSYIRVRYKGKLQKIKDIDFDLKNKLQRKYIKVNQNDPAFEEQYERFEKNLEILQRIQKSLSLIITQEYIDGFIAKFTNSTQQEKLFGEGQLDSSISTSSSNFRVNIAFRDEGDTVSPFIVIRKISKRPYTLQQMNINDEILKQFKAGSGLILISGPTGSAKSSTLTAILDYYNKNEYKNIITLEDPIEFFWKESSWDKSIILQREIWKTVGSYSEGIKAALRENPDIIIIGEMRDRESVEMMIEAANTGHLVIATGHVKSTTEIINRVLGFFDGPKSKEIALKLSSALNFVMNQRLVVDNTGTYRVLYEWLNTQIWGVPNLIKDNNLWDVRQSMKELDEHGYCPHKTLSESFFELIVLGLLSSQESLEKYINESPKLFEQELDLYVKRYCEEKGLELQEVQKLIEKQDILYRKKKEQWL